MKGNDLPRPIVERLRTFFREQRQIQHVRYGMHLLRRVSPSLQVQVAYYVLLLEAIIDADATLRAHLRLASHGGIWLFGIRFPPQPCCHPRSP